MVTVYVLHTALSNNDRSQNDANARSIHQMFHCLPSTTIGQSANNSTALLLYWDQHAFICASPHRDMHAPAGAQVRTRIRTRAHSRIRTRTQNAHEPINRFAQLQPSLMVSGRLTIFTDDNWPIRHTDYWAVYLTELTGVAKCSASVQLADASYLDTPFTGNNCWLSKWADRNKWNKCK